MARNYLVEAGDVIFGDALPAPLQVLAAQNRGQVVVNVLRALDAPGMPGIMIRKAAAYALGQLGDASAVPQLLRAYDVESAMGVKEAIIASISAIHLAPAPAFDDNARCQIIEDVYQGRRAPQLTPVGGDTAATAARAATEYVTAIAAELESAPSMFKAAFRLLSQGEVDKAASTFAGCVVAGGPDMTERWAGTALCYAAYCASELGSHEEAVSTVRLAIPMKPLLNGRYYQYTALFTSLNQLDRLDEALAVADEAIEFFTEAGSPPDVAVNLGRRANILKQMAAHLSRSADPRSARPVITAAVRAFSESLAITMEGFGDADREELSAMGRIAGRVGLARSDFAFLDAMPAVDAVIRSHFAG